MGEVAVKLSPREKDFLQAVRDFAELHGWLCYHTWNSVHSPAGFPDLVLVNPPRIVFAELKSERGRLTEQQALWIRLLRECGLEVYVWRPSDWEQIEHCLRRRR